MKVLIIEDDLKISGFIANSLKEANYSVTTAFDGEEGFRLIKSAAPDVIILDLMLPKIDGLALLEKVRTEGITTPVLILSAKQSVDDRVKGLQSGGDDYLVKPFSFNELLARIQVLIRRNQNTQPKAKLQFADISVDLITREVKRSNLSVTLHAKEFLLLEYFLQNPNRVLTKTQILEKIWGYNFDPQTNVVDVLVCRLRNKIDREFETKTIHTIRGVGYVLKEA